MSEMATEIETPSPVYTEWLVGDLQIPCDYSDRDWCGKAHAEWVLFMVCPGCGHNGQRVTGSDCKELMLQSGYCVACPACDLVAEPKDFIKLIEAL